MKFYNLKKLNIFLYKNRGISERSYKMLSLEVSLLKPATFDGMYVFVFAI